MTPDTEPLCEMCENLPVGGRAICTSCRRAVCLMCRDLDDDDMCLECAEAGGDTSK